MSDFKETIDFIEQARLNDPFELSDAILPSLAKKAITINPSEAQTRKLKSFPIPGCKHPLWKEEIEGKWKFHPEPNSSLLTRAALGCCSENQALDTQTWKERLKEFGKASGCESAMGNLLGEILANCKPTYREHQVVEATDPHDAFGITLGMHGTIVHLHSEEMFEVEFPDLFPNHCVITRHASQIKPTR